MIMCTLLMLGVELQVQTVEGLCVRVINNVRKRTETRPKFAEAFQHESYPAEFPYTQKVGCITPLNGTPALLYKSGSTCQEREPQQLEYCLIELVHGTERSRAAC